MNLSDALDAAIRERFPAVGITSPVDTPRGLSGRIGAIMRTHGVETAGWSRAGKQTRQQIAADLGTVPDTVTRWLKGQRAPSKANLAHIDRQYRSLLDAKMRARAGRARRMPPIVRISAVIEWGSNPSSGERYIAATPYRTTDLVGVHMGPVFGAFALGRGRLAVKREFLQQIHAAYGGKDAEIHFHGDAVRVEFP